MSLQDHPTVMDKQLTPYQHTPRLRWRTLPNCSQFPSQSVQTFGYVFHDTTGRNHGQTLKIQWFFSNETCTDIHLQASCGKDSLKKFCWDLNGKKYRVWEFLFVHQQQGLFLSEYVDDKKMAGREQDIALMLKKLMRFVDLGEPTSFLDHVYYST